MNRKFRRAVEAKSKGGAGADADRAVSRAAFAWNDSGKLPSIEEIAEPSFRSAIVRNYDALGEMLDGEVQGFIDDLCIKASSTRGKLEGKGENAHHAVVTLGAIPVYGPIPAIARLLSGDDKALLVAALSGLDVEGELKSVSVFGQVIDDMQASSLSISPSTIAMATLLLDRHRSGEASALEAAFVTLGSKRFSPSKYDVGNVGLLVLYRTVVHVAAHEGVQSLVLTDEEDDDSADWHETLIEPLGELGLEFGTPAPITVALNELSTIVLQNGFEEARRNAPFYVDGFASFIHLNSHEGRLCAVFEYPNCTIGPVYTLATEDAFEFAEEMAEAVWHDTLDTMPAITVKEVDTQPAS